MRKTGYREQYDRMMRWFSKLEEIYKASEEPPYDENETEIRSENGIVKSIRKRFVFDRVLPDIAEKWESERDIVYAFFQNCYHLFDWMEKDPGISAGESDLQSFRDKKGNDCLVYCMDLCNGSKHCDLKKADAAPHTDFVQQNGKILMKNAYDVVHKKGTWDALDLAKCCIAKMDEFIANHS